jgi:hypothetical protein
LDSDDVLDMLEYEQIMSDIEQIQYEDAQNGDSQ